MVKLFDHYLIIVKANELNKIEGFWHKHWPALFVYFF